jgi:Na+-translocating ferredoxin:NAD+ oxidoreductase RNF subunit RnfB
LIFLLNKPIISIGDMPNLLIFNHVLEIILTLCKSLERSILMTSENLIYTNEDKCIGCTNCSKRCPTEAIRIKEGKVVINYDECIYCGECLRACPYHANHAVVDKMEMVNKFKRRIAILDSALFAQFKNILSIDHLMQAVKSIGFTDVYNTFRAAQIITDEEKRLISINKNPPIISPSCPVISRLIHTRFPSLSVNLVNIESIFELTAKIALNDFKTEERDSIGVFFITPCIAKAVSIKKPFHKNKTKIDGAIAISEIFVKIKNAMNSITSYNPIEKVSSEGIDWAVSGGETQSIGCEKSLWVDGIYNVINIFEQIEMGKLEDIDFIEACSCTEGCISGALTVENPYVAKSRINKIVTNSSISDRGVYGEDYKGQFALDMEVGYKPPKNIDTDVKLALKKIESLECVYKNLPGIDCGACGAPNCRALAEDILRGLAKEEDCVVLKSREKKGSESNEN